MNYHFELFGWCWEPGIKTFWLLSWAWPGNHYRTLILFGRYENRWIFEILSNEKG